jgi:transposase
MVSRSDWKEGCRFRAVELAQQGWKQKDIAAALGVSSASVSGWLKKARSLGPESLRRRKATGPPRRLTAEQREQIAALLEQGAECFGFRGAFWSGARMAEVIRRRFGVSYSSRHAARLLVELGHSCQKPERRAIQRDEEAIEEWHQTSWPALKKGQPESGAPSSL